jgi:hypothetical protein
MLAACGGHASNAPAIPGDAMTRSALRHGPSVTPNVNEKGKIKHIVIVVQEGRSFDNMFKGFKGANYATQGVDSKGNVYKLKPISFASSHPGLCGSSADAHADVDGGRMDGWDHCKAQDPKHWFDTYTYVKSSETNATGFWKDAAIFDFTQSPRPFTPFAQSGYSCNKGLR